MIVGRRFHFTISFHDFFPSSFVTFRWNYYLNKISVHTYVETVFQAVLHRLVSHAFLLVDCSTIINVHFSRKSRTPTEISASFVHRHDEHSTLFYRSTRCTLFETVTMPNIAVLKQFKQILSVRSIGHERRCYRRSPFSQLPTRSHHGL